MKGYDKTDIAHCAAAIQFVLQNVAIITIWNLDCQRIRSCISRVRCWERVVCDKRCGWAGPNKSRDVLWRINVADDWLEDCLDNVNVPGALHVIMTSPGGQHKTQQACRKGQHHSWWWLGELDWMRPREMWVHMIMWHVGWWQTFPQNNIGIYLIVRVTDFARTISRILSYLSEADVE